MNIIKILRIFFITLISLCFFTSFTFMVSCKEAAHVETEEVLEETEDTEETAKDEAEKTIKEKTTEEMSEKAGGAFIIKSPAFGDNETVPSKYTCDAENINPQLDISGVPQGAASLVLIVNDSDAPGGTWVHWTLWNIDPAVASISENNVPPGAVEGVTDFGTPGYSGPCPPSETHRYFFKLFALDITLGLDPSAASGDLENAIEGHVLGNAELIGLYGK